MKRGHHRGSHSEHHSHRGSHSEHHSHCGPHSEDRSEHHSHRGSHSEHHSDHGSHSEHHSHCGKHGDGDSHSHHGWHITHRFEQVCSYKTPYVSPIPGRLGPGKALYFQGIVPVDGKEFKINLKTGQSKDDDTAFQFKLCTGQKVAMNCFRKGKWENEETATDKPFIKGAPFSVFFVITAEGYEVYVNGSQHYIFKHRIPLEKVSTIEFSGDVSMNAFNFIDSWSSSSFIPEKVTTTYSEFSQEFRNIKLPYVGAISGGIRPGMAVYFQGIIPQAAKQFDISFKTGQSKDDDTAFQYKPCIGQRVTLNSFRSGKWENEESASDKPFTKEAPFTMVFVIKAEGYEVYVNGFRHCLFKHRIPLEKVSALAVGGDVSVNILGVIENWYISSFFMSNFQAEMLQPVLKPALPYVSSLSKGLRPGMALCFQGTVSADAKEFEINLQTGLSDGDDKAFHFKPQIGQKVALNSYKNGTWESEESAPVKPFTNGAAFNMFFVVKPQCYEVFVNGFHHCTFNHRLPLEKVSTLGVRGNVWMNLLGVIENWQTSSFFLNNFKSEMAQPVVKPALPYVSPLSGGLKPGMALCFQGVVPVDAKEFEINLQTGLSDGDDKAFHFKPQIGQKVALNSYKNGTWESEESAPVKPFTNGAAFNMFFVVKPQCYEVFVNGFHHCTFNHRLPLEKVSTLGVRGNVWMNLLGVIENWQTSSFFLNNFKSEMAQPVVKPALPYVSPLSGGLKPGMGLCFQGFVPVDAKEFEINLQTGLSDGDDKAFHFKPKIGQKVALNSYKNGTWESEESAPVKPFTNGAAFNMFFVVKPQCYEVFVNGFHHCTFNHRLPLEKVSTLGVRGNVWMNLLGVIENWQTSSFFLNNFKSEMAQPVVKPALPYVNPLSGGLKPGMALCFQGVFPVDAKEFEINLQTGPSDGDDKAFHFKPQIGQKVALNSYKNGTWESEESAPVKPFTNGAAFNMFFVVKPQCYEVFVNGFHHCTFNHRLPLEKVSTLGVRGNVWMNLLGVIENWQTSSFFLNNFKSEMAQPVVKPALPYVSPLSGGLKPGMALCFQGVVPVDAKEFEINLQTGPSDGDDKAFHFKPQIGQKVALNSYKNGTWESEESAPVKPFTNGAAFNMFFVLKPQCYEVFVNGFHHCTFNHRLPLEKVSTLGVRGNVWMNLLGVIENWQTSSFFLNNFKSEMAQPVVKPALPYVSPLSGGLKPGMALCFQGAVPVDAKEFEINLQTGLSDGDDKAFHFKPKIGQKVALNSYKNGTWESEESAPVKPFTNGAAFNMFFVVKPQCYEVFVNGFHHCTFNHRLPLEKVSTLGVRGNVWMNLLGVIENWQTSSFFLNNFKSEMAQPVVKPALPYVSPLSGGLKPGMALCFQGVVPVDAKEFEINLQTGPSDGDDKAFHFKPQIGQKVALNSYKNGTWESEESAPVKPFTNGAAFNMFFVVKPQCYEVFINGFHHCTFNHRLPLEKVSTLGVRGNVWMNLLGVIEKWQTSSFFLNNFKSEMAQPVVKPALPYVSPLSGGLKPGMALCFQGVVPVDAKEFEINLQTGLSDGDDKAFHFKPKIGQKVALNSYKNGTWESEESAPVKPFTNGAAFNMFFVVKPQCYEVFVNGFHHCTFNHRLPLEKVSTLGVRGNVWMNLLGVIENWQTSSFFLNNFKSEMAQPVVKPALPYVSPLSGGLKPGMALCFQGVVPVDAKEFEINLQTGPSDGDDKAFHFKPQIGQKVALNSYKNGTWESEESAPVKPFTNGAAFNMFFVLKPQCYEVFVNGFHHCTFNHRLPLEKVSTLGVRGNVWMNLLGVIENWQTSSFFLNNFKSEMAQPVVKPALPYVSPLSGGLKPGMALCFQGAVPVDAKEFEINLQTGLSDGDDKAFHFKPKIGQKVALNSYKNGTWESEESAPVKPFTNGAAFNMFFVVKPQCYEVFVNGFHHCTFNHRLPLEKVSTLGVRGNVWMNLLGVIENWQTSSFFLNNFKSEMAQPVVKPALPYVSPLSGGLKPGMALCFQGVVPVDAKEFEINLQTGPSDGDDKAFHFKPQIGQKVALNSYKNGTWESEESAPVKPFTNGAAFNMFFVVKPQCYEVFINGFHHCTFNHRLPLEKVSTLGVRGNVWMNLLGVIEKWQTSSFFLNNFKSEMAQPVVKPALPYVSPLSGGLKPGMALCFQGVVPVDAKEFEINLQTGLSDGDDKAFHFKPKIGQKVALNSYKNGTWESEESAPVKPFTNGAAFNMFFVVKPQCYEVFVNGFHHCTFNHRLPLEKVSTLGVRGNVWMNLFGVIENWQTSSFFLNNFKSEMAQPVVKPALPYVSPLSGGLKPGMALCFQGVVPVDAKEFEINLQTGPSDGDDKAFHFKPKIGQKVALNSYKKGTWESEESAPVKPFTNGAAFNMFFVVKPQCYEVFVNGFHHCTFNHRLPLEKVSTLGVRGNVWMNLLGVIENWQTSSFFLNNFKSEMAQPVVKPALPYVNPLSGGLKPGMALCFQGVVPVDAKEFEINLQTGPSDGDDKAFHFKPQIGQKVALNSYKNGTWESEESAPVKPFTNGAAFNMFFVVKPQCYEVFVNGFHHCTFNHRLPLEKVSTLGVRGNVWMNLLGVIENWQTSSFFLNNFKSEMAQPVVKPALPYVSPLSGGLKPGMALCFQGVVPVDAKEFEINLQTGPSDGDDKAFHFKPQIGQRVALNSYKNGTWESEESAPVKPFTNGAAFNMFFVVKPQCYEVFVNGFHHCTFNHRLPLEKVSTLGVRGNVWMNLFGVIENWQTSSFFLNNFKSEMAQPVVKPALPYVSPLSGGLKPGMALCFQGVVPVDAKEFEINLQTGLSDGDDKAFHFKPQIGQKVALNSYKNGTWESEESAPVKPFTNGAAFNMFFVVKPQCYEVFVNGFHHCTFYHRLPLEKVSTLGVRGNVWMNLLGLIKNWRTSSFFMNNFQSELAQSVFKPAIPYEGAIAVGVKPDTAVCFQGTVPENADQFAINFKTGPSKDDDIAFHFNPHIGQNVTLNSFRNGKWENQESVGDNPFTKGAPFSMFVVITAEGYEVYVNGVKHSVYKHRLPVEKVSNLEINGDVSMNILGYIDKWSSSSFFTERQKVSGAGSVTCTSSAVQLQVSHPVINPAIPYEGAIPKGGKPDTAVCFQGTVPENADQFVINFKTGPSKDDDIAFHFNPHIGQNVTLNSFKNGKWENQESAGDSPFTKGAPFSMFVVITAEGYEVYVNGVKYYLFKHRLPVEKVSNLDISGNVSMNLLGYVDKWSSSSFFTELQKMTGAGSVTWTSSPVQLQVSHPVVNPAIPYEGAIPEGVKPDTAVCFQGTVPENADQFAINFKTGPSKDDDIAFHFSPHIGQNVTLNSFRNGKWENQESAGDNPFTKGAPFSMFVVITAEGYEVYVNGVKYYLFKHRLPVEKVSNLDISGNVAMNLLGYIHKWSSSSFFTELQKMTGAGSVTWTSSPVQLQVSHPVVNPAIPYEGAIPEGVKPDTAVCFQGTVPENADQFAINFKTGPSKDDDIAFHFNPHIGQNVTLNSFRNGKWENQESAGDNPFTKGAPFNMFVVITAEGYEVYVNGVKYYLFKHRLPVEKVSNLDISGNVSMNLLGYVDKWSSSSFFTELQKMTGAGSVTWTSSPVQLQVSHPVVNPAIPYEGAIPEGVKPDTAVCFQGTVPENADQFAINFKTGPSKDDDIAFHFNPHIGQNVTLNSFRNGKWENQESAGDNPFTKGAPFNMFVVITAEGYEVYVNGVKYYLFKHRLPVEKVSNLDISGNVSMNLLGYVNKWSSSSFFTELQKMTGAGSVTWTSSPVQLQVSHPVVNPAIPYEGAIPEGVKADTAVCFQGTVPENADQFAINFKTGSSKDDDIAFHFNPHIGQNVTLNSFRNGKWENQESVGDNPFTKGAPFNMFVVITAEGYEVYVNGVKYYLFKHRLPVEKVSNLDISGNVSMNLLGYVDKWSSSSFFTELQKMTGAGSVTWTSSPVQLQVSHPVVNPAIPYEGAIPEVVKPDTAVCFQGTVPENADQFAVNFKTGPSKDDDIAFHFNPHIGQNVTLNSFRNGKWENQESVGDNPFTKGAPFNMFVVITPEGYEVYVNGVKYYLFKHRLPVEKVSNLDISGNISMKLLGYIHKWSSSSFFTELQKSSGMWSSSSVKFEVSQPVCNPKIPYVGKIPGIKPNMAICFQGTVPAQAKQFAINFKADKDETAFHFKPHIGQRLVLNSFRSGKWEKEISIPEKPFTKEAPFNMFVVITADGYEVNVNGKDICMFKHRIPLEKVSVLQINGDVSINMIGFIMNWSKEMLSLQQS